MNSPGCATERVELYEHETILGTLTLVVSARGLSRVLLPGERHDAMLAAAQRSYKNALIERVDEPSACMHEALGAVDAALKGEDFKHPVFDFTSTSTCACRF